MTQFEVKVINRKSQYGDYQLYRIDAYKHSKDNNIFFIDHVGGRYREVSGEGNILDYFDTFAEAQQAAMDDTAQRLCEIYKVCSFDVVFRQGKSTYTKHFEYQLLSAC